MTVQELFEELSKSISLPASQKEMEDRKSLSTSRLERTGRFGQQADAFIHPRKPNSVVKHIDIVGPTDPAYQYIRLCRRHQDNPHFPKIYSIKRYPKKSGGYVLILTMERLYPIPVWGNDDVMYDLFSVKKDNELDLYPTNLGMGFAEPEWRKELYDKTRSIEMKQALRLLEPLFRHYLADMHLGNIMIRKNGTLVFVDPIQFN